jgi:hypothetical protein
MIVCLLTFFVWTNCFISISGAYEKLVVDELDIDLGRSEGLSKTSSISGDNLKKILDGVENGNPNNIYFYGLLKLYGISVTKDLATSSQNFLRASSLGHMEATTAYGLSLLNGMGVKKDHVQAVQFFRKAVELGDMVSFIMTFMVIFMFKRCHLCRMPTGCWESKQPDQNH